MLQRYRLHLEILVILIIPMLVSACRPEVKTITVVKEVTQALTSTPVILPSVTSESNSIPSSVEIVNSPTPTGASNELSQGEYPGFSKVDVLSDEILMPGDIDSGVDNMIDTLAAFGMGGGGGEALTTPYIYLNDGRLSLGNFPSDQFVVVELIRPDGSVLEKRFQGQESVYYCFDHDLMLQKGGYKMQATSSLLPVESREFEIDHPDEPTIYLDSCTNRLEEGYPTSIFFEGFRPNEKALVGLYIAEDENYRIINTWPAEFDKNGKLVQKIQTPKLLKEGSYGLAVFGTEQKEVFFSDSDIFIASVALDFHGVNDSPPSPPVIKHTTVTPHPIEPTTTPPFSCSGAPKPRVEVGDSIRVTYTDGTPLRLRTSPEVLDENIIELLAEGTHMEVIAGPECEPRPDRSDSFVFWEIRVKSSGLQGWVAEGDKTMYYIEKHP